jgi:hypothetical protein
MNSIRRILRLDQFNVFRAHAEHGISKIHTNDSTFPLIQVKKPSLSIDLNLKINI